MRLRAAQWPAAACDVKQQITVWQRSGAFLFEALLP